MRLRMIVLVTVAVAATAAVASAAVTAKDPGKLILQKKDFPVRADYEAGDELDYSSALEKIDAPTTGYYAGTYSEKQGHLQLHGAVITTPNPATAKKAFVAAKNHLQATWKAAGAVYKPAVVTPSYGDQQTAFSKTATVLSSTGSLAIVVRKRSVVWVLWALLDKDKPPKMSEVLADLKTYAAKQKARVGAG